MCFLDSVYKTFVISTIVDASIGGSIATVSIKHL